VRAFVTGATGFVGPHLCAHLRACGDVVVVPGDEHDAFDVTDRDAVHRVLERARPEVVYHLARAEVAASWREPAECLRVTSSEPSTSSMPRAAEVRARARRREAEEYGRVDPARLPLRGAPLVPITPYSEQGCASYLAVQAWIGSGLRRCVPRVQPHRPRGSHRRSSYPASRAASPTPSAQGPMPSRQASSIRCAT
jgi:GDP-4-dehydro-6-deoxy-D-mannose reductase